MAVTFEPPERAAAFAAREGWPCPILSDPHRRAYAALGLHRGRPRHLWDWGSLVAYARGLLRGRWPRAFEGDLAQLGGDVVLAPDRRIVLLHRSDEPADRPAAADLVAAVEGTTGRPGAG